MLLQPLNGVSTGFDGRICVEGVADTGESSRLVQQIFCLGDMLL
jgi:hypothetical protein